MSALRMSDATLGTEATDPYFYLVYASHISPKHAFIKNIFTDICHTSQQHNKMAGITGFLFFKKGKFFQYLEGSEAEVRALYQKIIADPRNKNNQILAQGTQPTRLFTDWAMHCFEMDLEDTSHEVSEYFERFDVMHWTQNEIQDAISEVKHFYQRSNLPMQYHYQPREASYMAEWAVSIKQQHATFILLQLVFIIVAFITLGYFMLLQG